MTRDEVIAGTSLLIPIRVKREIADTIKRQAERRMMGRPKGEVVATAELLDFLLNSPEARAFRRDTLAEWRKP